MDKALISISVMKTRQAAEIKGISTQNSKH
jgi:hypothetical protein